VRRDGSAVGADLGSSSCYDNKAFQSGSSFVSKEVNRDYEKWMALILANCPPYGDSERTGQQRPVSTCRPTHGAERRAETHRTVAPAKKLAGTRTEPHQDWMVRSQVLNKTRVREIGKMDE